MAESTQIEYDLKDLAELMVRHQGIDEGDWMVMARFSNAVVTLESADGSAAPSVVTRLTNVGIARVDKPNPISVNARELSGNIPRGARNRAAKVTNRR